MSPLALGRSRWVVVPRTRTTGFGPRSFSVAGPLARNSLPPEIKTTSLTLGQFCGRLKLKCFFAVTTRQRSRHKFYYNTAWKINSVTELNWTWLQTGAVLPWHCRQCTAFSSHMVQVSVLRCDLLLSGVECSCGTPSPVLLPTSLCVCGQFHLATLHNNRLMHGQNSAV